MITTFIYIQHIKNRKGTNITIRPNLTVTIEGSALKKHLTDLIPSCNPKPLIYYRLFKGTLGKSNN